MSRAAPLTLLLALIGLCRSPAAEIKLQAHAQPQGAVVRLGDVAEVLTNDCEEAVKLASLELFATPASCAKRFVRLREIQDALSVRGISLARHTFSGANQVSVEAERPAVAKPEPGEPVEKSISSAEERRAARRVRDSLLRYLREKNGRVAGLEIVFDLSTEQIRCLTRCRGELEIGGGDRPWSGRQDFELRGETADGPFEFSLATDVTNPPLIVVATRAISRGDRIGEGDVRLAAPSNEQAQEACRSLEEVVGQEALQALSPDQPIKADQVRAPLLVRRGEVVTVYARSPGLRVRTTGRVRDDGSEGELVTVESLAGDRKNFFARVCGLQEVEVYARAISAVRAPVAPFDDRETPASARSTSEKLFNRRVERNDR
ncbi:MAG: flagellar basal body P-ring formation chaperone FlgA [Pirellulales bacterium]